MNRKEYIANYERINRKLEAAFMPKVQRAIHGRVAAVIEVIKAKGISSAHRYVTTSVGNNDMQETIRDLYTTVGLKHARLNYSRLLHETRKRKSIGLMLESKGFGFNSQWTEFILNYLNRFLLEKITFDIDNTTRKALLVALEISMQTGLGVDDTIKSITDWPFERYQAARIVRTEVNRASNVGSMAQAETGEYEQQKEWISVKDFRTRGHNPDDHANHVALNGTKIDLHETFTDPRNHDKLMFPGDPQGKAESTINCRCQAVFVNKRDDKGNLIPKTRPNVFVINAPKEDDLEIEYKNEPEMGTI